MITIRHRELAILYCFCKAKLSLPIVKYTQISNCLNRELGSIETLSGIAIAAAIFYTTKIRKKCYSHRVDYSIGNKNDTHNNRSTLGHKMVSLV